MFSFVLFLVFILLSIELWLLQEVEKYRTEYNKLRYEFTFLKAEYDHSKADHVRNLEELRLR